MTELLGYRIGWTHLRTLESGTAPEAPEALRRLGAGACHVVPEGTATALCGTVCAYLEAGQFIGRASQCHECVKALRGRSLD